MPQSPALIRASPGTLRRPISGLRSRTVAEHIANPARAGDMLRLARGGRALLTHALSSGRWSVRGYVRVLYSSGGPLTRRPSALPFGRALPSSGGGSSGSGRRAAVVNWPGRATLFWWQLGVLKHLQQAYPGLVETTPMMGFSGGSFAAAFAACGVDPDRALQTAHRLCVERGAYSRPLGLLGVWGFIIRDWLDELLPDDAAERCSGVTSIFVTQLPSMRNVALDSFKSREDVIAACCASAHWPWVLNGQPVARTSDGSAWLDGGLRYYLTGSLDSYLPPAAVQFSAAASAVAAGMELSGAAAAPTSAALEAATPILVFDPSSDTQLAHERFTVGGSVLKIPELKEVTALVDLGYAYSRRMQEQGAYDMCLLPLAVGGAGAPPTLQLQ